MFKKLTFVLSEFRILKKKKNAKTKESLFKFLCRKFNEIQKEIWALLNYYGNYHLFNEEFERQNILENDNNMSYNDEDQFDEVLEEILLLFGK